MNRLTRAQLALLSATTPMAAALGATIGTVLATMLGLR